MARSSLLSIAQKYGFAWVVFMLLTQLVHSQCLTIPESDASKLHRSALVVQGTVVSQEAFFGPDGLIRTRHTLEVAHTFKGVSDPTLEVITEGGVMGNTLQVVQPSVQLRGQRTVLLFLNEADGGTWTPDRVFPISDNVVQNHAMNDLYRWLDKELGTDHAPLFNHVPHDRTASQTIPSIASISPPVVSAGTRTAITISGQGFGTEQAAGRVAFANADDGGQSFVVLEPGPHYLHWSDTQIEVYVPSAALYDQTVAGSGNIRIVNNSGEQATSAEPLTVEFAKSEIVYQQNLNRTALVGVDDGGYVFHLNTGMEQFSAAREMAEEAIESWSCQTDVRFSLAGSEVVSNDWEMDGISVLGMSLPGQLPPNLLGKTITTFEGCGTGNGIRWEMTEVDILLNSDINWSLDPEHTPEGTFDLHTSILHELGHAHLLQHNNHPQSPMYFELLAGDARRTLHEEADVAGGTFITHHAATLSSGCGNPAHQPFEGTDCNLSVINGIGTLSGSAISVYPNPASDVLHIELGTSSSVNADYTITCTAGREVARGTLNDRSGLWISDLARGIYFLNVVHDGQVATVRFVKN